LLFLISIISQSVRPCFWQSGACASLVLGRASFSRTHPAAITSARREHESEEARAARLARQKEYYKARREKETDEAREARLTRQQKNNEARLQRETNEAREARLARRQQYYKARRANEAAEARTARLARYAQYARDARARETDEQRQERLARRRQYYAESPERFEAMQRKSRRKPDIRAKINEKKKKLRREGLTRPQEPSQHEKLSTRRATKLQQFIFNKPWRLRAWKWKTHTPISYLDRVDHHCTACDENRFLKHWWKEKLRPEATGTDPNQDRYMCNHCFANEFNLMVPENRSEIPRLSQLFTSPNFPSPFRRARLKSQAPVVDIKDEHEEKHKGEDEGESKKEGRT
jgi:hypothetical protein